MNTWGRIFKGVIVHPKRFQRLEIAALVGLHDFSLMEAVKAVKFLGRDDGWVGGRYGCSNVLETWRVIATCAGFIELCHDYRRPGRPHAGQPWLASVGRRCER